MIEPDLQLTIKGLPEDLAQPLGQVLVRVIQTIAEPDLNLANLHRIIVARDFPEELEALSQTRPGLRPATFTNEEYASAVAQSVPMPREDGGIDFVLVFNAAMVFPIAAPDADEDTRLFCAHMIHHELCHVHDDNNKIAALPNTVLTKAWEGKQRYTHPLAYACWSEYFANCLSCFTATPGNVASTATNLVEAIPRTQAMVRQAKAAYRFHGDLERVLAELDRHGGFLVKSMAYVLGYADGLERSVRVLSPEAAAALDGAYFTQTARQMHAALREMRSQYPGGWHGLEVFDGLSQAIEGLFGRFGFHFTDMADGRVYVDVPW